jgi:hypothetical protein
MLGKFFRDFRFMQFPEKFLHTEGALNGYKFFVYLWQGKWVPIGIILV